MNQTNAWPEISEAQAAGDTARLYQDIREVTGIPLVNLIYRHIATIPDGLSWTWKTLRPVYESAAVATLGAAVVHNAPLPPLPKIPDVFFKAAGLQATDLDEIANLLDVYIHGNTMNLLAMSALRQILDEGAPQTRELPRTTTLPLHSAAPIRKFSGRLERQLIRPILQLDALNESTRALVTHLNKFGEGPVPDSVSPSLFRHLGYWPNFLCLAGVYLLPVEEDGSLRAGATTVRERVAAEGASVATHLQQELSGGLEPVAMARIRAASGHFADVTIPRLLAICVLLRCALPQVIT